MPQEKYVSRGKRETEEENRERQWWKRVDENSGKNIAKYLENKKLFLKKVKRRKKK